MESSRIFVRGLPPSMKEADLRQHFASHAVVTDAKFIPHRRIGYVGFKTPDAAAKAVKYFNRSFIRMSRINVELARPVDEMRPAKRRNSSPEAERPAKRSDRSDVAKVEKDPKLEAFMDNMKTSSKGRTWANEDFAAEQSNSVPTAVVDEGIDGESEDEYQRISKKRRTSAEAPSDFEGFEDDAQTSQPDGHEDLAKGAVELPRSEPVEVEVSHDGPDVPHEEVTEGGTPAEHTASLQPEASDADWLRNRTSRVLDLLDDDDLAAREPRPQPAPAAKPQTLQNNVIDREPELVDAEEDTAPEEASPATPSDDPKPEATDRLFVRNLPYDLSEQDLLSHFTPYGSVSEIHISKDTKSGSSKGFGYVSFDDPAHAADARGALDGKPFHGRLLHIIPAQVRRDRGLDEVALSKLPLKVQNQIRRKAGASAETFKWNSMYMSADAVVSSVASRLGVSKSDVLDPTSADAAIKQAHAETNTIQQTKRYLEKNGVDIDAFNPAKSGGFSDTAILVKNFPFGTTGAEIRDVFEKYGAVKRLIVPPSGTIAIVQMEQPTHARAAFKPLAYSKFKDTILYLEKAPKNVFTEFAPTVDQATEPHKTSVDQATSQALREFDGLEGGATSTLFVRNLNFSTTTEQLRDLFRSLDGFLSAKVKTRTDAKKPGQVLSMGFGFVEFRTKAQAQAALATMNGYRLAGHELTIRASHKAVDAAEERRQEDREKKLASQRTKVIIKNLPFEASKKDVRALFSPYGKLRSVRVPKKFDSSSRGFAFADFVTTKEASNAMDALKDTHLLGRKLVLGFAAADAVDPEDEIQRMQAKIERQTNKVAAQNLTTSSGRKKFRANEHDEDAE